MFIIPLCLFLISTYLRPRTQAGLSYLITGVECLSGLWCILFAPFQVQLPLIGFLLLRNRKAIRAIWWGSEDTEEESYLDLADPSAPTIDIEATAIDENSASSESNIAIANPHASEHSSQQPVILLTQSDIQVTQASSDTPLTPQSVLDTDIEVDSQVNPSPTEIVQPVVLAPFHSTLSIMQSRPLKSDRHSIRQAFIPNLPGFSSTTPQPLFTLSAPEPSSSRPFIQISF